MPTSSSRPRNSFRGLSVRAATAAALTALALSAAPGSAAAIPSSGHSGDWTVIGAVKAMAASGDAVYMAGDIEGVARRTGPFASFDPETGALADGWGELAGSLTVPVTLATEATVEAIAPSPDGGWYVAGKLYSLDGVDLPHALLLTARDSGVVKLTPTGDLDPTFRAELPRFTSIEDIEVAGDGSLWIAGTATGAPRSPVVALDGATGERQPSREPALVNGSTAATVVHELEIDGSNAFVAGTFTQVGVAPRHRIAQFSLADGAPTAWDAEAAGSITRVNALERAGSLLYVGGSFSSPTFDGQARRHLAALDAATGAVTPWDPRPSAAVEAIAVDGSTVYVGGNFTAIGATAPQPARGRLAALDATTGDPTAWDPSASARVDALALSGGRVYAAGSFTSVAGEARCGLAAIPTDSNTPTAWDPRATDSNGGACFSGAASHVAVAGGRVWAAGGFRAANLRPRTGLAAVSAATGAPLDWAPSAGDGPTSTVSGVHDLAVSPDGATVYLGGTFSQVNGIARARAGAVAAAGSASGVADVRPWDPVSDARVSALAFSPDGGTIYLGGFFTTIGGEPRRALAAVSPASGEPTAWAPAPNGNVNAVVAAADGTVFAAGDFTAIGSQAPQPLRKAVAALDPLTGAATAWAASFPADRSVDVKALAVGNGLVYASYADPDVVIGGQARAWAAAFAQATGDLAPWNPQLNGSLASIAPAPDGTVYAFGGFTEAGGAPRRSLAALRPDGTATAWEPRGIDTPAFDGAADIQLVGGRVVVGTTGGDLNGTTQTGLLIFAEAVAPAAAGAPLVRGPVLVGGELTCGDQRWSGSPPLATSYQWLRGGEPIVGATSARLTTTGDDANQQIACRVTASNPAGEAVQTSEPLTVVPDVPVNDLPPAVGGDPRVGRTATCSTGVWANSPSGFEYRWLLDGAPIAGAEAPEYVPVAADDGHSLTCEVVAGNGAGDGLAAVSAAVTVTLVAPAPTGPPTVSGATAVGSPLTCTAGSWERAGELAYQWLRDGQPIAGATGTAYSVSAADQGHALACRVTATNSGGSTSAASAPLTIPAAPGEDPRGHDPGPPQLVDPPLPTPLSPPVKVARKTQLSGTALKGSATAPGAGRLSVTAFAKVKAGKRAKRARVGRVSVRVGKAGAVRFSVKLSAAARKALAKAGKRGLKVDLQVVFTAGDGASSTARATVTVRRPAKRARSRG